MKICGRDGVELQCFKTGLTIHDDNYHPFSRHQADAYYCPSCKAIFINRAEGEYFDEHDHRVDVTIKRVGDPVTWSGRSMVWNKDFVRKIKEQYGLEL